MTSRGGVLAVLLVALPGAVGCGASSSVSDDDGGAPFVAYNVDFKGYDAWRSFSLVNPNPGGATHIAGTRTIYINHDAPPGATEFPRGTIIVKETAADGKIFARVKRGGAFNLKGAKGWEWFELEKQMGVVGIKWRGVGPPIGEVYGGDPNAGCNMCHKLAASNDFVLAPGLSLQNAVIDASTGADAGTDTGTETGTDAEQN